MTAMLLFPMAFMVFYIWSLGVMNFVVRFRAIKTGEVKLRYFKSYTSEAPEHLIVLGRHFDNQFQLPMLFLITCLVHLHFGQAGTLTLVLAWLFVASRLVHSYIHLGPNKPSYRALAYALGWLCVNLLWILVLLQVIV